MSELHPFIKYRNKYKPPMPQAVLARKLEVSRSCINHIENGKRQIGIDLMVKASALLKMSPKELRPDLGTVLRKRKSRK